MLDFFCIVVVQALTGLVQPVLGEVRALLPAVPHALSCAARHGRPDPYVHAQA